MLTPVVVGKSSKLLIGMILLDVNLLYPNAKVAAALCVGGPCKYVFLKNGTAGITTNWLLEHVVPHIVQSQHIHQQVASVLALRTIAVGML